MNHKGKNYETARKQKLRTSLAACTAALKADGMDAGDLDKDPRVRRLRAEIRKADARLAAITASETLNSQKLKRKQDKAAGIVPEKPAKEEPKPAKKEKKAKEKKQAPAEEA
ncbi:MAG: hypothetical protein ACOZBW_10770 [Thermodesulfobacteriota bacterium]